MKSKSPLTLIEQMIMLLVFAIAAAVCIRAFVWADTKSKYNSNRSHALVALQSTAEMIKNENGDFESAAQKLTANNYRVVEGVLTLEFENCIVTAELVESPELTGSAAVTAFDLSGEKLAEIEIIWQEAD